MIYRSVQPSILYHIPLSFSIEMRLQISKKPVTSVFLHPYIFRSVHLLIKFQKNPCKYLHDIHCDGIACLFLQLCIGKPCGFYLAELLGCETLQSPALNWHESADSALMNDAVSVHDCQRKHRLISFHSLNYQFIILLMPDLFSQEQVTR